jgi:hypothetical protein
MTTKDNARRNSKACSTSSYHNYNTRNRKSHPYNTRYCGSSHSGSHNDVSRFVDTSAKKVERTCTKSSAPVSVHLNNAKLSTHPQSSVVTPKQSNRLVDKIPVPKAIQNPYKQPRKTHAATNNASMPYLVTTNSSTPATNDCNTVSPLPECVISTAQNSRPIISPSSTTQTSKLTIAQKRRIAMNKARALAIRAKAEYTTPLKKKEAAVSLTTNPECEKINICSDRVGANLVSSTTAMMPTKWYCAICNSIVNPYIVDRSIIANGDPICANCLVNLKFSQESVTSVNV